MDQAVLDIDHRPCGPDMSFRVTGKDREMSGGCYEETDGVGTETDSRP